MTTIITLLALTSIAILAGRIYQLQQDLNTLLIAHDALDHDLSDVEKQLAHLHLRSPAAPQRPRAHAPAGGGR